MFCAGFARPRRRGAARRAGGFLEAPRRESLEGFTRPPGREFREGFARPPGK